MKTIKNQLITPWKVRSWILSSLKLTVGSQALYCQAFSQIWDLLWEWRTGKPLVVKTWGAVACHRTKHRAKHATIGQKRSWDKPISARAYLWKIHEAARSLTQGKTCVPRLPLAQTRQPLYEENCGHLDGRSSCATEHHQRSDGNFIENVAEHLYDISTPSAQGPTDPQQRV